MLSSKALFIVPNLPGHLQRTIKIGQYLKKKDCQVAFLGNGDTLIDFCFKHRFIFLDTDTKPFLFTTLTDSNVLYSWLNNLKNRWSKKPFLTRKKALEKVFFEYRPDIVFLDTFTCSDYIILKPLAKKTRFILLETMFPKEINEYIPPNYIYAFPDVQTPNLWRKHKIKEAIKNIISNLKYLGKTKKNVLSKYAEQAGILEAHPLANNRMKPMVFENIEEWIEFPEELDFPNNTLKPYQYYIGGCLPMNTKEKIDDKLQLFLASNLEKKAVYLSMGTIVNEKLTFDFRSDESYTKILKVCTNFPSHIFICKMPQTFIKNIDLVQYPNLYAAPFLPQNFCLRHAAVFITHAGGNSILEAIHYKVPMLLMPLDDGWEKMGNAARMVYHGLGLRLKLDSSVKEIAEHIEILIENTLYKNNITAMANALAVKYTEIYFENQLSKLLNLKP